MTFEELSLEILSFSDSKVEITDFFVLSTHEFVTKRVKKVSEKLAKQIDPKDDWYCKYTKKCFIEILNELQNGRFTQPKKLTLQVFVN